MTPVREIDYPCKFDSSLQKAMFLRAGASEPRPLVIGLHTWGGDYTQASMERYAILAAERNWHMLVPDFRGPNRRMEACGSDFVISDLEDALAWVKEAAAVDDTRIYLIGGSGGAHCALLMAARRPDLWSAAAAWCPISDLALWHRQCRARGSEYADDIESSCGGNPEESEAARLEARKRSPVTWLSNAAGRVPVDIAAGIHDGHSGSVPVGHSIEAYNLLAAEKDRITKEEIAFIEKYEKIPGHLKSGEPDPAYGERAVYFRRESRSVRITLFEGGHDMVPEVSFAWFDRQRRGRPADWSAAPVCGGGGKSELDR